MKTARDKTEYPLPDDLYRIECPPVLLGEGGMRYVLHQTSIAYCITLHRQRAPGAPTHFTLDGRLVMFAPVPDGEHEIVFTYVSHPKDW